MTADPPKPSGPGGDRATSLREAAAARRQRWRDMIETARVRQQAATVTVPPRRLALPRFLAPTAYGLLLAACTSLFACGLHAIADIDRQLARSIRTTGRVVALAPSSDGDTRRSVIAFDADGVTHTYQTTWASNPPAFDVGDTVDVAYVPGVPGSGIPLMFSETHAQKILFLVAPGLCGMLLALLGLFGEHAMRRLYPHLHPGPEAG